ncbi:alpha/beta fold hydrolase [Roseomonas terrae]|jgi:pimeloyl-ACP methyl ester carboxylesterase|uniref:Alpha/beta fold hydrolase n=1 Tax=Neoroseomonas terrae TaxID=424799 RepID=A0ABS5EHW3_9PROT|nr:alpha/beta fold hydrolase [Neoroseomonas terrae]MBR0650614.1 alpha/beta fold hydrolase [Neoroseomonas terrae]
MSVSLQRWGSFHVGGREVRVAGEAVREVLYTPGSAPARLDPNGTYLVGGMYAQFMLPEPRRGAVPLMLWHGGGLTGACWETTPDGREGWQHFFLRQGWEVVVGDAVERGRAGWTRIPEETGGAPVVGPLENPWLRFRIGPGTPQEGRVFPGQQFPSDPESWRAFIRQNVPRFTTTDEMILAAYGALLDRVGPSAVVAHSQGGFFGWRAAQEWPDKVRALVLVEPASVGLAEKVAALRGVPVLMIFGDYIAEDARWPTIRGHGVAFADAVRAAGGSVDVMDLPARGIRGNSHMIMMDRNSDEVAALVQDWLASKGLWR